MSNTLPKNVAQVAGIAPPPPLTTNTTVSATSSVTSGSSSATTPIQSTLSIINSNSVGGGSTIAAPVITPALPFTQPHVPSKRTMKAQEQAKHHTAMTNALLAATDTLSTIRDRSAGGSRQVHDLTEDDAKEFNELKKQRLTNTLMDSDLRTYRESMNDSKTFVQLDSSLQEQIKGTYSALLAAKMKNSLSLLATQNNKATTTANTNNSIRSNNNGLNRASSMPRNVAHTPLTADDGDRTPSVNMTTDVTSVNFNFFEDEEDFEESQYEDSL